MRLDILSMNDSRSTLPSPPRSMWQVGAIVAANALRDPATGQLWLEIGQQRLPTRLASGHTAGPVHGEQLKLRVLRTVPVLAVETIESSAPADLDLDALRRFLPRQSSPAPVLANLSWLMRSKEQLLSLPGHIQKSLRQLWDALPQSNELLQGAGLKQALQQSGTFMERLLAGQQSAALTRDYKANLLWLRQQLRSLPPSPLAAYLPPGPLPSSSGPLLAIETGPASLAMLDSPSEKMTELLQQIEGNLARIHANQILNHQYAQEGSLSHLVELPFIRNQRTELLRLKISRDSIEEKAGHTKWRLEIALDLGQTRQLNIVILLHHKSLHIQFRSETSALVSTLNEALPSLLSALTSHGFNTSRVVCMHGSPIQQAGSRFTHLLDMQA